MLDEATGRIASPGREKHFIGVPRAHAKIADGGVAVSVDGRRWAGPEDAAMREALSTTFGFKPMLKPFDPVEIGRFPPSLRARSDPPLDHGCTAQPQPRIARQRHRHAPLPSEHSCRLAG